MITAEISLSTKTYVILVARPMPALRSTQGDRWAFRIPEHKQSLKMRQRKIKLVEYNNYKETILLQATNMNLILPDGNFKIEFFIPVSASWSKKKKLLLIGQPHVEQKPDIDNLCKPVFDALLDDDHGIYDVRISKYWCNEGEGRIEITVPEE